jgi:methylmalonyl-CoA mutase
MAEDTPDLFGDFPRRYLDDWERLAAPALKGRHLSTLSTTSPDGVARRPLYTRQSFAGERDPSGLPGFFPYTRGPTAAGTTVGWDVRQSYADPDVDRMTSAIAADLEAGVNSVSIATPIADVHAASRLLEGVPEGTPISIDAETDGFESAAIVVAASEAIDRPLVGNLGTDPLRALLRTGRLPVDVDASFLLFSDLARHVRGRTGLRTVLVHGDVYDDGGATDAGQLAYTMATGLTYLRALIAAGFTLAEANEQIAFRFAVGPDVFAGIAKLRAARMIWSRITGACGARDDARRTVIEAITSRRALQKFDVWVNVLRATTSAFASVAGGADAIVVRHHLEPLGLPDDAARRIAKNVQLVLRDESGVGRVVDPAGGAWVVEHATLDLAKTAWKRLQEVESQGGVERAIESGFVQRRIEESYAESEAAFAARRRHITGLTDFPWLDEPAPPVVSRNGAPGAPTKDLSIALDAERGRIAARAIELAREGATVADLTAALAKDELPAKARPLAARRDGDAFEALRIAAADAKPSIRLVAFGHSAGFTPRVTFAQGFFGAAGIRAEGGGQGSPKDAAAAVDGAAVAVLCASDEVYVAEGEAYARAVKRAGVKFLYVCGAAGANGDKLRRAGVDAFVHDGVDALTILRGALELLGVKTS